MKKQFEDFIYQRVKRAKDHEVQEILSIFSKKKFNKGEPFKKENTAIKKLGFLVEGSARNYFINDKGDEITDQIVQINNFLSDIISVRTGDKSPIIIEIIEKSIVLVANMESVWSLLEYNVTFNILIREYIGDRSMELVKRHLMFLNGTAKERYQYILETNPEILKKYPLKYIASMIGVTQTQLSRIRKEKK
ncbi:cAMP-binding domain of CRP or a regulatory subunit of cAMP-dependent protein kinases [Cyclobacterium xiamenense]|uniref:cAMP-binding domain of CRP or a regulatory subunit of cAMP-dependent protein kinases n=1 Tax=Cyclobacterium xiamenense TaxID=1297121 RepID=A0A1H6T7Q8_9BACT|nr:Crp/Fnr family transcriptional regulator [Cyclobacterium xiamenense]SEI75306.1 cAMP-binding domain of CRP or a regulatory subunit of cAMP-dependent protein kinases [Cyclobacterium xiamenense]